MVGLAILELQTKFEVSRCTRYEAMNGSAKLRKWGGLGSLKVIGNVTIRYRAHTTSYIQYSTLTETMRLYYTVFFWDVASYLSKVADVKPPTCIWRPRRISRLQKSAVPGLSCGVICAILCLAVFAQYRLVTDGQTNRQTDSLVTRWQHIRR